MNGTTRTITMLVMAGKSFNDKSMKIKRLFVDQFGIRPWVLFSLFGLCAGLLTFSWLLLLLS